MNFWIKLFATIDQQRIEYHQLTRIEHWVFLIWKEIMLTKQMLANWTGSISSGKIKDFFKAILLKQWDSQWNEIEYTLALCEACWRVRVFVLREDLQSQEFKRFRRYLFFSPACSSFPLVFCFMFQHFLEVQALRGASIYLSSM